MADFAELVAELVRATEQKRVKWQRTDDEFTFMLNRPQGIFTIWRASEGDLLQMRVTDSEGQLVWHWEETMEVHPMDALARELFDQAEESASEIKDRFDEWMSDLRSTEEPF